MAHEGTFIHYTGEEAAAYRQFDLEHDAWWEAVKRVEAALGDREDRRELIDLLATRHSTEVYEYPHVLHARLCRVFPHLANIFTFLFWPEFMPTPEWVNERGMPTPWTIPTGRCRAPDA